MSDKLIGPRSCNPPPHAGEDPEWLGDAANELKQRGYKRMNDPRDLDLLKRGAYLAGVDMEYTDDDTVARLAIPWVCELLIDDAHAIICARLREMCIERYGRVTVEWNRGEKLHTRNEDIRVGKYSPYSHYTTEVASGDNELRALVEALEGE